MRESLAKQRTKRNREVLLTIGATPMIPRWQTLRDVCKAFDEALRKSEQLALAADVKLLMDNDASPEDAELDIRE